MADWGMLHSVPVVTPGRHAFLLFVGWNARIHSPWEREHFLVMRVSSLTKYDLGLAKYWILGGFD